MLLSLGLVFSEKLQSFFFSMPRIRTVKECHPQPEQAGRGEVVINIFWRYGREGLLEPSAHLEPPTLPCFVILGA